VFDLDPEVFDGHLLILTAVGFLTALNELAPVFLYHSSGRSHGFGDLLIHRNLNLPPGFLQALLKVSGDFLAATSALITSLEELAEFFLSLSEGSFVNHLSVATEEGLEFRVVPRFDIFLDFVQVV